ncbi:MAG: hypothetical protein KDI09_01280 [Halioglobus sp.]|nr:hypothetical protein [Halioglobus sp.]
MKKPQPASPPRQRRHDHGVVHRAILSLIRLTGRFNNGGRECDYQTGLILKDEHALSK